MVKKKEGGASKPAVDWVELEGDDGPVPYRREKLYEIADGWARTAGVYESLVACAPHGGFVLFTGKKAATIGNVRMRIFSPSGVGYADWLWRPHDAGAAWLMDVGWTVDERVITVGSDGATVLYSSHGEELQRYPLTAGTPAAGQQLLHAKVLSGKAVVGITQTLGVLVLDLAVGVPVCVPELTLPRTPSSICLVPHSPWKVYLAAGGEVHVATPEASYLLPALEWEVRHVAASSAHLVALGGDDHVAVIRGDDNSVVADGQLGIASRMLQLRWCGEDCPVAVVELGREEGGQPRRTGVVLCGPRGGRLGFEYTGMAVLVQEQDCVRLLSSDSYDMLQRVPQALTDARNPDHPIFQLRRARAAHAKGNPQAVKMLRSIGNLRLGVLGCLEAAMEEYDLSQQVDLLHSASFGRAYQVKPNVSVFDDTCAFLRVARSIRDPSVAIPLTKQQFEACGGAVGIITRLLSRRMHTLALSVAEYVHTSPAPILLHWAVASIETIPDDATVIAAIKEKFAPFPSVSLSKVVTAAVEKGRKALAVPLLHLEPMAKEKVHHLLLLGERMMALQAALSSNDADLVMVVLVALRRECKRVDFIQVLKDHPDARALYLSYCARRDVSFLQEYYNTLASHTALGHLSLRGSDDTRVLNNIGSRVQSLRSSKTAFERGGAELEAHLVSEQLRLLEYQEGLAKKLNQRCLVGQTLAGTVKILVILGEMKEADLLKKEFAMSDRNFWWVKLRSLCDTARWDSLEAWVEGRDEGWKRQVVNRLAGSPIGFEPFVAECLRCGQPEEAKKYIPRIENYAARAEAYCRVNMFTEAIATAIQMDDTSLLLAIRSRTADTEIHAKIDEICASRRARVAELKAKNGPKAAV